jgi:hypothetical protein
MTYTQKNKYDRVNNLTNHLPQYVFVGCHASRSIAFILALATVTDDRLRDQGHRYSWPFGPSGTARPRPTRLGTIGLIIYSCCAGLAHMLRRRPRHGTNACYPCRASPISHTGSACRVGPCPGILSTTSSSQNFTIYSNFTSKNLKHSHIQTYTYI